MRIPVTLVVRSPDDLIPGKSQISFCMILKLMPSLSEQGQGS
jgi:hypothetical protein